MAIPHPDRLKCRRLEPVQYTMISNPHSRRLPPRVLPARSLWLLAGAAVLLCLTPLNAESLDGVSSEITLPVEQVVGVDLRSEQDEKERAVALERAKIAASLPGAAERERIFPEMLLIHRKVMPALMVMSSQPDGPKQTWRVRGQTPPRLYAEVVIVRLIGVGFSTTPGCPGDEWSGIHGAARVAVRVEPRTVAVQLVPIDTPCSGVKAP